MTTKILGPQIAAGTIQTEQLAVNTFANTSQLAGLVTTAALAEFLNPKITNVNYANSAYGIIADTGVQTSGGYIVITGQNFFTGVTALVDTTPVSSISRVNNTTLRVQVPAKSEDTYNIFVVNPDGGTGIRVNGIRYFTPRGLWSWGFGSFSLGFPTDISRSSPVQIGTDLDWASYSQGSSTSFAIKNNGTLWGWGTGSQGELGRNNTISTSSPVQIGTDTNWGTVDIFGNLAIKTNGTLWGWGSNGYGINGRNNTSPASSPIQVGALTNWSKVIGSSHCVAIKTDGTLWTWGRNQQGNMGLNNLIHRSSPVQVGTDTNWSVATIAGSGSTHAIRTNGTLWAWGRNTYVGQLGIGNRLDTSSPVQVGFDTNWSKVAGSYETLMAIRTNGTLWAWGGNAYGQLGIGSTGSIFSRSSPVQVGALTNWSHVQASQMGFLAIKTDGTLWSWGRNNGGQLGLNDVNNRASPVQVGNKLWSLPNALHEIGRLQGMVIGQG